MKIDERGRIINPSALLSAHLVFAAGCAAHGIPPGEPEYRFCKRRWRLDCLTRRFTMSKIYSCAILANTKRLLVNGVATHTDKVAAINDSVVDGVHLPYGGIVAVLNRKPAITAIQSLFPLDMEYDSAPGNAAAPPTSKVRKTPAPMALAKAGQKGRRRLLARHVMRVAGSSTLPQS